MPHRRSGEPGKLAKMRGGASTGRWIESTRPPHSGLRPDVRLHANDWVGQTLSGGRYRVDAKLGEGGMGFVYKVWDRNLDTDVVIKAPRKSMLDDPEFASRFALEIRSLVKLSHPNIVKVSDVGEHDERPLRRHAIPGRRDARRAARLTKGRSTAPRLAGVGHGLAPRDGRGARLHPRQGVHPPRRQAGEHPLRFARPSLPERLRRRQGALRRRGRRQKGSVGDDRRSASSWARRNTWRPS